MAKTRVKKVVISGITLEQAEIAFSEFATADAKVQNIQSKMDMEITRIRDKYADALAEQQDIKEKNFEIMQTFATEHREELFSRRKVLMVRSVSVQERLSLKTSRVLPGRPSLTW